MRFRTDKAMKCCGIAAIVSWAYNRIMGVMKEDSERFFIRIGGCQINRAVPAFIGLLMLIAVKGEKDT